MQPINIENTKQPTTTLTLRSPKTLQPDAQLDKTLSNTTKFQQYPIKTVGTVMSKHKNEQ